MSRETVKMENYVELLWVVEKVRPTVGLAKAAERCESAPGMKGVGGGAGERQTGDRGTD